MQVVLWFKIDREDFEMKETEVLNVVKNNLRTQTSEKHYHRICPDGNSSYYESVNNV